VDFDLLGQKLELTLTNFSLLAATLNDKTGTVSEEMNRTLIALQETADNVGRLTDALSVQVADLNLKTRASELGESLKRLKTVLGRADVFLRGSQDNLTPAMENFRIMSENLREFSETAKRYPSQIIFGQAPGEAKP
jgi:phospholipid/cholesterol/gamma-HCH transport system substrate-binding protein/paraquat-inducible protein B